jgi:hypothetical protein
MPRMRTVITLLTLLILTSCLRSNKNSSNESIQTDTQNVVIDTLLSKHRTIITMNKVLLTTGVENEIQIKIKNIETKDIVIYTSTSEATVKIGKKLGNFAVTPKTGINQVTITVNYLGNEGLVKLGRVMIKTTHNN